MIHTIPATPREQEVAGSDPATPIEPTETDGPMLANWAPERLSGGVRGPS